MIIVSAEEAIVSELRGRIARLELAPGSRLALDELAERYDVSPMPVRQALRRLAGEGLVLTPRHRAATVAPLDFDELEELIAIQLGLEVMLVRRAAENCTPDALAEMGRLLPDVEAPVGEVDFDMHLAAVTRFREICFTNAERPRLMRALATQSLRLERYIRYLNLDHGSGPHALYRAGTEPYPSALLEACRAHDSDAAERTTRDWIALALQEWRRLFP
jgi:DNA-binding GntR family transcriptional regulator